VSQVLITGMGGFLGSHLAEFLSGLGHAVAGTVHRDSSHLGSVRDTATLLSCDILDGKQVQDAVETARPELVFHFAAQSLPLLSWQDPETTFRVNVLGTLNLLEAVRKVGRAGPDVFANNIETVRRLTPIVRDQKAGYDQTLAVLARMKLDFPGVVTKSSIMVGLGERGDELEQTMCDLRAAGVDILTIGQYLRPSAWHLPVMQWVTPEQFEAYKGMGEARGFRYVASGPLVRSSYRAAELFLRGEIASRRGDRRGEAKDAT